MSTTGSSLASKPTTPATASHINRLQGHQANPHEQTRAQCAQQSSNIRCAYHFHLRKERQGQNTGNAGQCSGLFVLALGAGVCVCFAMPSSTHQNQPEHLAANTLLATLSPLCPYACVCLCCVYTRTLAETPCSAVSSFITHHRGCAIARQPQHLASPTTRAPP